MLQQVNKNKSTILRKIEQEFYPSFKHSLFKYFKSLLKVVIHYQCTLYMYDHVFMILGCEAMYAVKFEMD